MLAPTVEETGEVKLHERTMIVQKADCELGRFVLDWMQKYDLTWIEAIRLLMAKATHLMRYPLRTERHGPNSNKKADEA